MVDVYYDASENPLSLGQFSPGGKLKFDENIVYTYAYTNMVVTRIKYYILKV